MGHEFDRAKKLSEYIDARVELTEQSNLPISIYLLLACDKSADVRYSLASNANIPIFILKRLSEDENVYVSCRAKKSILRLEQESIAELKSFANITPVVYDLGRS